MKLQYSVTILQGSVCTYVRWRGRCQHTRFSFDCCSCLPNLMESVNNF